MIETRILEIAAAQEGERTTKLCLHLAGRGPLAILLHGFPLDHRMWTDVLHGELRDHRTLCAIDLRGHGQSPWSGDNVHSMDRLADDTAAVIRSLSDDGADVCGLSMGGYVAFALQARHPQLVRSLVLTNTRAAADTDAQRAARDEAIATVASKGRSAIADGMLPKLLAPSATALQNAQLRTMIEAQPAETIIADLIGLQQRPDRTAELGEIRKPTLAIAGQHDAIVAVDEMRAFAGRIPESRFEVVPGTGHMSPLEAPAAWGARVAEFWIDG
ncbi:MAG: alpha/beta fold hydrolase [Planctomycetota bacterium]